MRRSSYHSFYSLRFVSCILLFALFAAQSVLAQDWDFVDVSPGRWINMELNDVFFIGGQGWAAGANGTIIHTHDGTRWGDQASGVDTDLYGIYFETTLIGWAVGERGTILNTEDSGITWKQQESPTSATLYDVNFSLAGDGLIVGSSGTILGKLSHNRTWTIDEDEGIGRNNLNAVYMYNNTRGWAVGDGGTILFWNGSGWLEQVNPSVAGEDLHDVYFTDVNDGWIVGDSGLILRTTNGGAPWDLWKHKADAGSTHLLSVNFVKNQKNNGYIVGKNGTIVRTSDSGNNWFKYNNAPPTSADLNGVYALDNNEIWAVGDDGTIITSKNRGQLWEGFVAPPYGDFHDIYFDSNVTPPTRDLRGWIVGDDGIILKLQEDDITWSGYTSPTTMHLYGLHMYDQFNGLAVGEAGTIIKSKSISFVDNGSSSSRVVWELQEAPTDEDLHGAHLAKPNNGWVVGNKGTIIHWNGISWTHQASNVNQDLYGVFFVNDSEGWVVGGQGTVLYTDSGGITWNLVDAGVQWLLREVYFIDRDNGWFVGDLGTIIHWDGDKFTEQESGSSQTLFDVDFVDSDLRGWVSGVNGTTINTIDGGGSWNLSPVTPGVIYLYGIDFAESSYGFAVGGQGGQGIIIAYVGTVPVPSADIELIAPSGHITTLTPEFQWQTDKPNLVFEIFIDDDSNPYDSVSFLVSGGTSFIPIQPLEPGIHYWGIRAPDGALSTPASLEFTAWPPTEVTLVSPADSGYVSETSPTFQWDCNNTGLSDQGELAYTLFINDGSVSVSINTEGELSHTLSSADPLPNLLEGSYTWWVETSGLETARSEIRTFTADLSPPTGTVEINKGDVEFTNSLQVDLTLAASDQSGIGVSEMQFSNNGSDWSDPEAFAVTKTWDLSEFGGNSEDGAKIVYARFRDVLGHWMTMPVSDSIGLDTVPPTGMIVINEGAAVTGPEDVTLSLSVSDDRSGAEPGGQMVLSNNGTTWSPFLPYVTSRAWAFDVYDGNNDEGMKTVYVKFMDAAGNWMQDAVSDDIELDKTGPTGTILINNGDPATDLSLVSLTLAASDQNGVAFMRLTNGNNQWSPVEPFSNGRRNWDISAAEYGGDSRQGKKTVFVRFIDSVGNESAQAAFDDIIFSTEVSASVQIFAPEIEGRIKDNDIVSVEGSSDPGLAQVTMNVLDDIGRSLDLNLAGVLYDSETGLIAGSFPVGELSAKTIQFQVAVEDILGNQADATSNILTVDNDPPANGAVSIDQGLFTTSTSVGVTVFATDVVEMYLNGNLVGQNAWIPYAETSRITLTEGDGVKEVRVKFRDDMGNESAEISDQITLDTTPPTGSIVINNGDEFTGSFKVVLTLLATDENGIVGYQLSNDGSTWSDESPMMTGDLQIDEWDLTDFGGSDAEDSNTAYVRYKDKAGNWGEPASDSILVDTTAPTISAWFVEDGQEALLPVRVRARIKSENPITEANLHYRRKGAIEYMVIPMTPVLPDHVADIPGQDVTLDGVEYYFSANDGRFFVTLPGQEAPINPFSFTVVDTERPVIEHEQITRAPVKSSPEIIAKVTDAVGVKRARLFYKVLPDRTFTEIDMLMDSVPDEYSANIPALDELGTVAYYIKAWDLVDNSRLSPSKGETQPYTIAFVDTGSPEVAHTKIADGQEAGNPITIGATIVDNMVVDSVVLKYRLPNKVQDMEVEMTNIGSFYSAIIPGEGVMPGIIAYSITVSDGSSQSSDTEVSHSFTVVDTTPPDIDITFAPFDIEVHNSISIQAEVTDKVAVATVSLFYRGVQDVTFNSIVMDGKGNIYSATIPAQGRPGEVKFYVYAEDSNGVSSTEPAVDPQNASRIITVIDITNPVIEHSPLLGIQEAGVAATITATVTDDVEVVDVSLHYRTAGNTVFRLGSMTRSGDSSLYSGSIPSSDVIVPGMEYYIRAVDEVANVVTHPAVNPDTLPHSFRVEDTVPPEIIYDPSGLAKILVTDPIVVTVEVTDLTGIKEIKVFYRSENESDFKSLMAEDEEGDKFSAQIPSPLAEGRIYYYIQAEDNSGNSATSPVNDPTGQPYSTFVDDPFPPLPPTRLTADGLSGGRIILIWEHSPSSDVDGYNIYTDNGSGTVDYSKAFDFVALSSLPSDSATWESPALGEGLYNFVVRAIDKSGNEEDNTISRSALADATKPQPATNLLAESHPDGRTQLTWTLSASKDAAAYNIYWDDAQVDIDYSKSLVRVNDPNVSWTSDKLRDGVVYRFVVRCQDQAGNEEENTNFVSARADATPPGLPTNLSSSTHDLNVWSNQSRVTVTWAPAEDTGAGLDGYSLLWNTSAGTLPNQGMDIGNVTTATATLAGTQYLHLRSVDKAGNWSNGAAHLGPFLIDTEPPQAPTNLKAAPLTDGKIGLSWGASGSSDVVRYNVYGDNGSGRGVDYNNPIESVTGLSWTSPELTDGTTNEFGVRAEDRANNEEKNAKTVSSIADSQPPSIDHKPIAGLLEQDIADVSIEVTVTDASGLESVKLNYRKRGVTNYTDDDMTKGANNRYRAEIPASTFSSAGVDYYVSAIDQAGNVAQNPVMTIAVGTVLEIAIDSSENEILLGDGSSINFPAGSVTKRRTLTITVPKFIPEPQQGLRKHIATREFGLDEDLSKSIKFTLGYSNKDASGEDESKLGVYLWNGKTWDFVTDVDEQDNQATVTTMRLGIFSIMGDTESPEVSDLRPSGYAEPQVTIKASVKDSGSGIDPQSIRLLMNGQILDVPGTALKGEELILALPQPVQPGNYSLQLTVLDNVGNQTVTTGEFHVEGKMVLKDVYCYPNPFRPSIGANFAYILTESANSVTIRIFGMDGKLARKIEGTALVGRNIIEWDGRDEQDESVLSSVYICHIEVEGSEDTVIEIIKIAGWE